MKPERKGMSDWCLNVRQRCEDCKVPHICACDCHPPTERSTTA